MSESFSRAATAEDLKRVIAALNENRVDYLLIGGYALHAHGYQIDPSWFEDGDNIRVADAFVIDLMLNAGGETYESMQPYAVTVDFEGLPVRTVSLEGLLKTKQRSPREKDAADRAVIERALSEL